MHGDIGSIHVRWTGIQIVEELLRLPHRLPRSRGTATPKPTSVRQLAVLYNPGIFTILVCLYSRSIFRVFVSSNVGSVTGKRHGGPSGTATHHRRQVGPDFDFPPPLWNEDFVDNIICDEIDAECMLRHLLLTGTGLVIWLTKWWSILVCSPNFSNATRVLELAPSSTSPNVESKLRDFI